MVYNMFFYDKVPLGFYPDKTPKSEAEEIALRTMKTALSDNPGPMSPDDAVQALTKAFEMGFVPALYWCGWLYQYQTHIFMNKWYYGQRGCALMNYRKAENFYLKAIYAGDMNAHYGLSTLYFFGNYDCRDCYLDGYPGVALLKGLYHMLQAAENGVSKAAEALCRLFANDIYNTPNELQNYMHGIAVNRYRDQSGLRYDENGELLFDPDALGLLNLECIRDEVLSDYWKDQASNPKSEEPPHITDLTVSAAVRLFEYEKDYLSRMERSLKIDKENFKSLRKDDRELRWKDAMNKQMQDRINALPNGIYSPERTAIYDEYAEKRKNYFERKKAKMKNAIKINVTKADAEYDLGASKFFGAPTVPEEWVDDFSENEMFFCQIRLSDIAELDKENKLPHTGYLYIFLDTASFPYNARVLYYDGEPDTVIDEFNCEVPYAEHLNDSWLMSFEQTDDDDEGIKLFGVPADWCYEEEPPRILMQYDPLASEMGFRDSIDGYAYFAYAEDSDNLEDITYLEENS